MWIPQRNSGCGTHLIVSPWYRWSISWAVDQYVMPCSCDKITNQFSWRNGVSNTVGRLHDEETTKTGCNWNVDENSGRSITVGHLTFVLPNHINDRSTMQVFFRLIVSPHRYTIACSDSSQWVGCYSDWIIMINSYYTYCGLQTLHSSQINAC